MPLTITDCWCAMPSVSVRRPGAPIRASIALPRSKSVANRALVLADLAGDVGLVHDPGDGDDTRMLLHLLKERPRVMHCGLGGTTFRFLLAWACVQEGEEHVLTGDARLLERPHDALVDALRALGADITRTNEGYRVRGKRMPGGAITIHSPISSQYISALMLVASRFAEGMRLSWSGLRLSEPYVRMTMRLLEQGGVQVREVGDTITVAPGNMAAVPFTVPADWSAAAFWFQIVALNEGSEVLLNGLTMDVAQGDREAAHLWSTWVQRTATPEGLLLRHRTAPGPWTDGVVDLQHVPDLFQPLAFTLAARGMASRFRGLDNLPLKETDRLKAVADVLHRMGVSAHHKGGEFHLSGAITQRGPLAVDPMHDHRMAMSTAPMALVIDQVIVSDPEVVNKSYPGFWNDLKTAGFAVSFQP